MKVRIAAFVAVLVGCAVLVCAGEFTFSARTDKSPLEYRSGEKMTFTLVLLEDGKPVSGKTLKWNRSGDDGGKAEGEAKSDEPLVITTSIDRPGFVRIRAAALEADGKALMNGKAKVAFDGGAGADLAKIEGGAEPADFDEFWAKQKAELAKVPLEVLEMKEVDSGKPGVRCWDVKVSCAGGMPVSGYLCMPEDAKAKSLPAEVSFRGYSVVGATRPREGADKRINFQINAHGIENGRPDAYYNELKAGKLKSYGFRDDENRNPETNYFKGVVLRLLRALEFVKTLPEWNGRELSVSGGSQGGFQAVAGAALDPDVTSCYAAVPWLCDLSGVERGRLRGWRPDYFAAWEYFDTANLGKRVRCPIKISAGLGDYTCPPSGVTVLYNNIKAPKLISWAQGRTHSFNPKNAEHFKQEAK